MREIEGSALNRDLARHYIRIARVAEGLAHDNANIGLTLDVTAGKRIQIDTREQLSEFPIHCAGHGDALRGSLDNAAARIEQCQYRVGLNSPWIEYLKSGERGRNPAKDHGPHPSLHGVQISDSSIEPRPLQVTEQIKACDLRALSLHSDGARSRSAEARSEDILGQLCDLPVSRKCQYHRVVDPRSRDYGTIRSVGREGGIHTKSGRIRERDAGIGRGCLSPEWECKFYGAYAKLSFIFTSVDLYVPCALVLHGVNALHGLLDLAYFGKLLAHFEIDLKGLREFFGSVIRICKADEHHRLV